MSRDPSSFGLASVREAGVDGSIQPKQPPGARGLVCCEVVAIPPDREEFLCLLLRVPPPFWLGLKGSPLGKRNVFVSYVFCLKYIYIYIFWVPPFWWVFKGKSKGKRPPCFSFVGGSHRGTTQFFVVSLRFLLEQHENNFGWITYV